MCGEPCQVANNFNLKSYQEADTWVEAFHNLVYLKNCEMEGKIKDGLKGVFAK